MSKITKEHVEAVRAFWYSYGAGFESTEVVQLIDNQGVRSILIKEKKT